MKGLYLVEMDHLLDVNENRHQLFLVSSKLELRYLVLHLKQNIFDR